jgi:hypothetical protein
MTTEALKQRLRGLAEDLKDDPTIDHRHVAAILWAISALVGFGKIQELSQVTRDILVREYEQSKQEIENN